MELLQNIWNGILDLTKLFVIPDWGSLIALLPVFMAVGVIGFLIWILFTSRRVGPKRRRPGRITPKPPPGVHLPGPTYAPFFAAIGVGLLFLGLVFPGPLLLIGVVVLILSLLYWGRESFADYDHVAEVHPQLPPVVHTGPPPGVHMPGPSFRPILASIGVAIIFLGLVFPGWILAVGIAFTIVALLGWLNDARKEYQQVVRADTTGHLENEPAPNWPKALGWVFGALVVLAIAITAGWFPPRSAVGGTAEGSPVPGGSPAPGGSGAPGAPGTLTLVAKGIAFNTNALSATTGKPFKVVLDNQDAGTPHDFDILDAGGTKVFDGKDFPGVAQKTYDVPALDSGTYKFECSIHPALMNGQLTVGG